MNVTFNEKKLKQQKLGSRGMKGDEISPNTSSRAAFGTSGLQHQQSAKKRLDRIQKQNEEMKEKALADKAQAQAANVSIVNAEFPK